MLIEILNKEQFLEAVKEDPSLLIVTDTLINNEGQEIIFFSRCSEPFTMDEYNELCKELIYDLEALALRAEQMIEIHSPIPPLKGESVFSPKNRGRTHKTGVTREIFIKELGKLYHKTTDRVYLQALGLTQEEINQIAPMPQGSCSLRYPTYADKNRKL